MANISFGRFVPGTSVIHQLDPRTKLAALLLYCAMLFVLKSLIFYGICFFILLMCFSVAGFGASQVFAGVKPILVLAVLTLITQYLITGGFMAGILLASRIALLVSSAALISYTTTPNRLASGLGHSLKFLERFHVPVGEMSLMTSIALRFVPVMVDETHAIMEAQRARGVEFGKGNLWARAKKAVPLAIPLFAVSLRRSATLAQAMESRGYRSVGTRSELHPLAYERRDTVCYMGMALFVVGALSVRIFL